MNELSQSGTNESVNRTRLELDVSGSLQIQIVNIIVVKLDDEKEKVYEQAL